MESGLEKDVPLDVQCMLPCISHTHSYVCIATTPVMCVSVFWSIPLTPLHKVTGRKGDWAFEHASTGPGLLCDCGQLTAEDMNMNNNIVWGFEQTGKPFTFPSAIKFPSCVGGTTAESNLHDHMTKIFFFYDCCINDFRSLSVLLYVRCRMLGRQQTTRPC